MEGWTGEDLSQQDHAACADQKDNDGDTYIDCDDANCCAVVDCKKQPSTYCGKLP